MLNHRLTYSSQPEAILDDTGTSAHWHVCTLTESHPTGLELAPNFSNGFCGKARSKCKHCSKDGFKTAECNLPQQQKALWHAMLTLRLQHKT